MNLHNFRLGTLTGGSLIMALRVMLVVVLLSSKSGLLDAVTLTPSLSSRYEALSNATVPSSTPPSLSMPSATPEATLNAASSPSSTDMLTMPFSPTSLAASVPGEAKTPLPTNTSIIAGPNTAEIIILSTTAMLQPSRQTETQIPSISSASSTPEIDTTQFMPASSTAFKLAPTITAPASSSVSVLHPSPSHTQLPTAAASSSSIVTPKPTLPANCLNVVCGNSLEHCVNNGTHDRCECLSAYYRPSGSGLCHRDCEKSYCYHGGKCERGPNGRVCRCVSPYSGVRCENERQISIQIAVGSSIMAVVLVVSLCLIVKNNIKNSEKKKEKHGWDLDLEAAMSNEAENEELPQVTGEPVVEECNQQELKEGKDNDDIAESTAHHTAEVRTEAANGSPPRYETVVEINNRPSKCSDSPYEIKVENEIDTKAGHADAPQAYANAAAEASVEEEEKGAEESAL